MDMYVSGNELKISVENIREFKDLLETSKMQSDQLNKTLQKLSSFHLSFSFESGRVDRAGEIESASSTVSTFETK